MTKGQKSTEKARREAVREWSNTPSPNPRYKGATPAALGRALLRKPPVCHTGKLAEDEPAIKLCV